MGRWIRNIIVISLVLFLMVVSIVGGMGYIDYKEVVASKSVHQSVSALQENPHYVKIDALSADFVNAVVAIEDHRFYEHEGIDVISLIRITLANIVAQDILGGGSTITQQLAKNFYFMDSTKFARKVSEAFVARALEENYTKDEILEMYVNIIYYGDNHYGVYEASWGYFNCDPSALSLAQASVLAGLPQAPSVYALSNQNKAMYTRQEEVLKSMVKYKYINNEQFGDALKEPLY